MAGGDGDNEGEGGVSDFVLSKTGDLDVTDLMGIRLFRRGQELAALAQRVQIALRSFKADWFLDVDDGVPYLQQILGSRGSNAAALAGAILRDVVRRQPGIVSVDQFDVVLSGRALTVTFTATTNFGDLDQTVDVDLT